MKTVAISSNGRNIDSGVEPRFGRARFFILVDPITKAWKPFENLRSLASLQGVGVLTAKTLSRIPVQTVVTGNCGPKAFRELQAAGVKVFLNAQGTVRQALTRWQVGELEEATGANVNVFWGQ